MLDKIMKYVYYINFCIPLIYALTKSIIFKKKKKMKHIPLIK